MPQRRRCGGYSRYDSDDSMSHSRLRASTEGGDPVKQSIRRHGPALFVVIVAAVVVAACGQVTTSEEARPAGGLRAAQPSTARLVQADVCIDGDPCAPTGAHGKHPGYACTTCHRVGGRLAFDPAGPAYGTGTPSPSFDATAKTCSNVACHGVPAGHLQLRSSGNDGYRRRRIPGLGVQDRRVRRNDGSDHSIVVARPAPPAPRAMAICPQTARRAPMPGTAEATRTTRTSVSAAGSVLNANQCDTLPQRPGGQRLQSDSRPACRTAWAVRRHVNHCSRRSTATA